MSGAKLVVPAEVMAGKPGVVTLTLPATLDGNLTTEAGKLGLSRAAQTADASAILGGEGYAVLPDGVQTARLKPGEAATFNWQVTPMANAKPPLMVDVGADLKGAGKTQSFTIAEVIGPSSAPAPADTEQAGGSGGSVVDKLAVPGNPVVDVPGVGIVKSGVLVLFLIGLVILVLAIALYNRMRNERLAVERRRKQRQRDEREREEAEAARREAEETV